MDLATERFDRGLIDSRNVIDAQRQEYEIERQYVSAQASAAAQSGGAFASRVSRVASVVSYPPFDP